MADLDPAIRVAHLSPHLSLWEFLHSDHHPALDEVNVRTFMADPVLRDNALRLARDVFEPVRRLVGPLKVTSGYRCDALNRAVGGSGYHPGQKPSAHMDGRAVDVEPLEMPLAAAMERIVREFPDIPAEKVIYEAGTWLHLQVPRAAEKATRVALMWFGGTAYLPFDASDPRVAARAA